VQQQQHHLGRTQSYALQFGCTNLKPELVERYAGRVLQSGPFSRHAAQHLAAGLCDTPMLLQ
jgi:hypothetical protein